MNKITINKIIEFVLFFYILSLYFLTQQEGLNLISNASALVLIFLIWVNVLMKNKKIKINNFSIMYTLFIISCIVSIFYAEDGNTSFIRTRTLILSFVLMFSLLNYINSIEMIKKILSYFVISGFLMSTFILFTSDFSHVTRMGSEIGNVNTIGMLINLSAVISFYHILETKSYKLLPIFIINTISILLTGSRQSLIFLVISIVFLLFFVSKGSIMKKTKYLFIGLSILIFTFYLIYNVPIFYQIIGVRMESLLELLSGRGTSEGSLNTRTSMLKFGIDWFKDQPLLGYGVDNYRYLLNNRVSRFTYSHNNIIELLVGIGIVGTFYYFAALFIVLKGLFKITNSKSNNIQYLFITILISYLVMSISSVYYYDKSFNIILAVSSALPNLYYKEKNKNFILETKSLS